MQCREQQVQVRQETEARVGLAATPECMPVLSGDVDISADESPSGRSLGLRRAAQ